MKTSKKILSFFLAVVMVVTTCSVGFTAMAAEKNSTIWSTDADAESAFAALNGLADDYLPSLLMGLVGDGVYKKIAREMGKEVDQLSEHEKAVISGEESKASTDDDALRTATLTDILQALQPVLINALKGESQGAFVSEYLNQSSKYASRYDYLNDRDDTLSYYVIVNLAESLRYKSDLSSETRQTLLEWVYGYKDGSKSKYTEDSLWSLALLYEEAKAAEDSKIDVIKDIAAQYTDMDNACLYDLKNFDFVISDEEQASVDYFINYYNSLIAEYNVGIEINDFADLIWFGLDSGFGFRNEIQTIMYINLINAGGSSADLVGNYDLTGLGNVTYNLTGLKGNDFIEKIIDATLTAKGTSISELVSNGTYANADKAMSMLEKNIALNYLSQVIFDGSYSSVGYSSYYTAILKGYLVTFGGASLSDLDTECASGVTGEITDADMEDMASVIAGRSGNQSVADYFRNGEITYNLGNDASKPHTTYLPEALRGTNAAEYIAVVLQNSKMGNDNSEYRSNLVNSIAGAEAVSTPRYKAGYDGDRSFTTNVDYADFTKTYTVYFRYGTPIQSVLDTKTGGDIYRDNAKVDPSNYTLSENAEGKLVVEFTESYWKSIPAGTDFTFGLRLPVLPSGSKVTVLDDYTVTTTNSSNKITMSNTDIDTFNVRIDYALTANGNYVLSNRSSDIDTFKQYIDDAERYFAVQKAIEAFALTEDDISFNYDVYLSININVFNQISAKIQDAVEADVTVTLTDEQRAILNKDCPLDGEMGTEIVNYILNNTILGILQPSTEEGADNTVPNLINGLVSGLLDGEVDLVTAIADIWERICTDPIATIFELLPLVATLIDSFLIPLIVNGEGDNNNGFLDLVIDTDIVRLVGGLLGADITATDWTMDYGSFIGIDSLSFDLNILLPQLMDWLLADDQAKKDLAVEGISYYDGSTRVYSQMLFDENGETVTDSSGAIVKTPVQKNIETVDTADMKRYKVVDQNGNEIVRVDTDEKTTFTYMGVTDESLDAVLEGHDDSVFTYYMTYEANVPHLTGIYVVDKALRDASVDDLPALFARLIGNEDVGTVLGQVVAELANLFETAVDIYVGSDLVNQTRYNSKGDKVSSGLNNLFVSIPQLFDIMEDLAAEKYNAADDNWTYCYDGRITTTAEKGTRNALLERFKSYANSSDPNRKYDILDTFAEIFVENWLNAIFDLIHDVASDDNDIANNLPIVMGLLNALGGFGEESIITDVINSVFQITRESEYSFDFTDELTDENNKLTGLTKDNAYFLLSNIDRLIEVVMNLVAHFSSSSSASVESITSLGAVSSSAPVKTATAKATSSNYSSSDLSNTKDLIGNLDKMLSSLLSDSTLNGFSLDSTENIIAGIVSLLDKFLGKDIELDNDTAESIVILVNQYLFYITGSSTNLTAKDKNVDPEKVYTNNALTGLVVETYALIEKVADCLLQKFYDTYDNNAELKYNLLVEAIDGVISPDAVGIRLVNDADYSDAGKKFTKYNSWTNMLSDCSRGNYKKLSIDWGISGSAQERKEAFYDGLAASLRLVTSILGVLLVDTGWYDTVVTPVLGALCDKNGIELTSYDALVADKKATGYYDETLIAVITPLSAWINALLGAPASTLIKSIQGLAGLLDDNNKKSGTIESVLSGAITPIANELIGLGNIFGISAENGLIATSVKLQEILNGLADKIAIYADPENIKLGDEYKYGLSGNNIIPIVNSYLAGTGIALKQISWSKIYSSSPEGALVYVLEYLLENILDNDTLTAIAGLIDNDIVTIILEAVKAGKINAKDLLAVLNKVLEATDSPTLAFWTFAQYLQEIAENFKYPAGITKAMADQGVETLDNLVANIFPLLSTFGVDLGANDLSGILNEKLFTNKLLTTIATALYGALDGLDPTIKTILGSLGIVTSTKDVAKILTDSSYGKTFTSAANTIKAKSSWKDVKNINWGFTDGSSKAQQGFVNALVAILRPLDNILEVFLNEGTLQLSDVAYDAICAINVPKTSTELEISGNIVVKLTYSMKNGVFTLRIVDAERTYSSPSELKLDFKALKNLNDLKIEGTNGYNSAIIPLMEAFKCTSIKSYSQYQSDVNKAKDSLLLDILNPILGESDSSLLNKLTAAPFATLCDLLPNIAMYLDAHGLSQLLNNLLAPVTQLISSLAEAVNVNGMLDELLGTDLGSLVGMILDVDDVTLDLTDLSTFNVEDLIIPIIRVVLESNDNATIRSIKLYDIDWNALISLGTKSTYTSKATGADGNFLTGKTLTNVDQGKTLITVLRYIAKTLIANAKTLKGLLLGIDAIKKSDILTSIIASVMNTLSIASPDQLVSAIFYITSGNPRNAFWDYTSYKTGNYTFAYPESVDVDFLKNLSPMLDGLIGGLLDLNGLIGEKLFTDSLISKLATALYGAIEGVKINDNLNLTALLAQTGIDFSTANVASLLTNKDYGKSFDSAAATIKAAGSWKNVKADSLKWGVTDRDSFFHALVAVLRPIYGVLDVLLNDAYLGLFDLVRIPGSNGYTSSIVPLMEAFSMYNIKTQYQYRQDMSKEYDAILLDIINPLWDLVEDVLNAPIQTIAAIVPNLALFIGNNGLCQIIDNLLTPISALADAIRPIVDLNSLLDSVLGALNVDLNSILGKIGIKNFSLDLYDLNKTLKPILSGDAIIPLVNNILGLIKIKGTPLGIQLNSVDWLKLASHGKTIVSASQAATYGSRIFVQGDASETLIAVLRYLIETINAGDNFENISGLIAGLLGDGVSESISGVIDQVLGMLQGDTDEVIASLVDLLQTLA